MLNLLSLIKSKKLKFGCLLIIRIKKLKEIKVKLNSNNNNNINNNKIQLIIKMLK